MKPWRDPLVWIAAVVIAAAFLGSASAIMYFTRSPSSPRFLPAAVTVIPAPSEAPQTPTLTPTPLATATVPPPPPPLSGSITVGGLVQVRGTGGDGLRFRTEPSLSAPIVFLGKENEIFRVTDGPVAKDGYTWWKMVAVKDPKRTGWAVSNYLAALPTPTPTP